MQGEASSSSTQKNKNKPAGKRKIKLRRVFEREFFDFITIQLIEFYIISKPIYRRDTCRESNHNPNSNSKPYSNNNSKPYPSSKSKLYSKRKSNK
jgi:hypothetical protein